jgi:hypothetical protein
MTTDADSEFYRGDDYVAASLLAAALSEVGAQHWRFRSEQRGEHVIDLLELCDVFRNVAIWLVEPTALPAGTSCALDGVLRNARSTWVRAWIHQELTVRRRPDLIARLEAYHLGS